jgi:hypothetical protein
VDKRLRDAMRDRDAEVSYATRRGVAARRAVTRRDDDEDRTVSISVSD